MVSLPYPSSSSSALSSSSLLPTPTIIYSDNHLLAVNKPAGWHSVPNVPKQRKKENNHIDNTKSDKDNSTSTSTATAATSMIGSKKCLLTHLQQKGLGGGSKKDFLVPLHRIDQPCTGIILFGKTSKAASRVTKVWKGKRAKKRKKPQQHDSTPQTETASKNLTIPIRGVMKDYLCVVPTSRLVAMEKSSVLVQTSCESNSGFPSSVEHPLADGTQWNQLDGLMLRSSASSSEYGSGNSRPRPRQLQRRQQQQYYQERLKKGRSVKIVRRHHPGDSHSDSDNDSFYDYDHDADNATMRPVHAKWKIVHVPTIDPSSTLLLVRTSEGARHMVRALLAQVGDCPILGDVRYWKAGSKGHFHDDGHGDDHEHGISDGMDTDDYTNDGKGPLRDRSVALHAYGLYFDSKQLQLGSLDTFEFRAPIPSTWKSFFGIDNDQLRNIL